INLNDYDWDARTWKNILARYPYGIRRGTTTAKAISAATGSALPYLRADWFASAASQPPLYHELLRLPQTDRKLEQQLGIDVAANITEAQVARSGFRYSGVSRNNRLIERHETPHGAYWKSYDFSSNVGRGNLFAHPLGPGPGGNTFQHNGGEIIF